LGLPDEQQALVLGALRRAEGRPVSFSELREAGIEFPATIVSELELAGIAIERCRSSAGGASVRLVPAPEPPPAPAPRAEPSPPIAPPPAPIEDDWGGVRRYRSSSRDDLLLAIVGSKRLLAPVALVVAIAVAAIIVLTGTGIGAGGPTRPHLAQRPQTKTTTTPPATVTHSATAATTTAATTTASTPAPAPTPVSLTLATRLESQGHDLLTSGQYGAAVPVLRRALAATGEHVTACVEPASTMCLTYAYALYDLGRALRLSGDPTAAVPVLESRLQIDNQRPTVLAELQLARQGAT
jgi:hypothetical protein